MVMCVSCSAVKNIQDPLIHVVVEDMPPCSFRKPVQLLPAHIPTLPTNIMLKKKMLFHSLDYVHLTARSSGLLPLPDTTYLLKSSHKGSSFCCSSLLLCEVSWDTYNGPSDGAPYTAVSKEHIKSVYDAIVDEYISLQTRRINRLGDGSINPHRAHFSASANIFLSSWEVASSVEMI